jgi:hypothetical protein
MRLCLMTVAPPIIALIATIAAPRAAWTQREFPLQMAQTAVPPTGMEPESRPMTAEQRMQARFPQTVRVGDLIGLPVLDESSSTLGHVREVVRTPANKIVLVVAYGGFLGLGARLIAVPIEVVGIQGREIASLDMPPADYAAAPSWRADGAQALGNDTMIRIALSRR